MANFDGGLPASASLASALNKNATVGHIGITGGIVGRFIETITVSGSSNITRTPIFRSLVAGQYVYTVGNPAAGFTFTAIIGYT